jgi:hypothetical protein
MGLLVGMKLCVYQHDLFANVDNGLNQLTMLALGHDTKFI